jgi:hypothetical protein
MRRAARRDSNDQALAHSAREMGALMVCLDEPCDWLVGYRGKWFLAEIKSGKGKYTKGQRAFIEVCQSRGLPVWTWRTLEDVVRDLSRVGVEK